jgi:hypothetical protein
MTHHRTALALCPAGHEGRAVCIADLLFAMGTLAENDSAMPSSYDLSEIILLGSEVEKLLDPSHPYLVDVNRNRAVLHLKNGEFNVAFMLFQEAAMHQTGSTREKLSVAVEWAAAARINGHASTHNAYMTAMDLFDQCQITCTTVDSKYEFFTSHFTAQEASSLSSNAASFAIEEGRLEEAVEILERGRTFVWATMCGYRTELSELQRASPELAERFASLNFTLERFVVVSEQLSSMGETLDMFPTSWSSHTDRTMHVNALRREWQSVLQQIRKVAGFRDFLQPLSFDNLLDAAVEGPVIMLNLCDYGADVLILSMGSEHRVVRVSLGPPMERLIS